LRLSQRGLARQLQVDPRTVRHWAVGNHRIPHAVALLLRAWTHVPRLIPPLTTHRPPKRGH